MFTIFIHFALQNGGTARRPFPTVKIKRNDKLQFTTTKKSAPSRVRISYFKLAQLCAGGDSIIDHDQIQLLLTVDGVNGAHQHTAGLTAHHLSGRQVGDGHQGLAHQLLGLVELGDAGQDLTIGAGAVIQSELQQLVGLLHVLAGLDLHSTEVGLAEGLEINVLLSCLFMATSFYSNVKSFIIIIL